MTCFTFNILNYVNIILRGWLHSLIADHVEGCFSRSISLAVLYGPIWEWLEQQPAQRGCELLLPCCNAPLREPCKPRVIFTPLLVYSLVLESIWCPSAVPVQHKQDKIVPVQSSVRKSGGVLSPFSKILQRGRNAPFPGRAEHVLYFPGRGLQGCCRDCAVLVVIAYLLIFFLPSLTLACIGLNAKRASIGNGNQVHKCSSTLLKFRDPGRYSCLRLQAGAWEGWTAAVSFYTFCIFSTLNHWASTQWQGITFKEGASANGWLVLDPQTSSNSGTRCYLSCPLCQKCN